MSIFLNETTDEDRCYYFFSDDILQKPNRITLITFHVIMFISIITCNIWMMTSLWRFSMKFLLWQKLLFGLCLVDAWTGFVTIPVQLYMITQGSNASCFELAIQGFTNALTPMMSCILVSLTAVVRYFNIANEKISKKLSPKVVYTLLFISFLLSLAVAFWHSINTQKYDLKMQGYFYTAIGLMLLIFLFICIILNVQLLKYITKVSTDKRLTKSKKDQQNVSKTILIMSSASIFSYFPSGIVWVIAGIYLIIKNQDYILIRYVIPWLHALSVANGGMNSMIYLIRTNTRKRATLRRKMANHDVNRRPTWKTTTQAIRALSYVNESPANSTFSSVIEDIDSPKPISNGDSKSL